MSNSLCVSLCCALKAIALSFSPTATKTFCQTPQNKSKNLFSSQVKSSLSSVNSRPKRRGGGEEKPKRSFAFPCRFWAYKVSCLKFPVNKPSLFLYGLSYSPQFNSSWTSSCFCCCVIWQLLNVTNWRIQSGFRDKILMFVSNMEAPSFEPAPARVLLPLSLSIFARFWSGFFTSQLNLYDGLFVLCGKFILFIWVLIYFLLMHRRRQKPSISREVCIQSNWGSERDQCCCMEQQYHH